MKPNDGYFGCPCCKECNNCEAGFQKILDLKKTGLVIYRHISYSDDVNDYTGVIQFSAKITEDVFILHNTKNSDITSADYLPEIEINAIPCPRCRKIVENAQKLLEKVPAITRNDVKGICEHCRMKASPCIECNEVVKKFVAERTERAENRKEKVKKWISKVKGLLKDSASEVVGRVRAHSQLHIDELCRDTDKSEREPDVKQMFRDDSNFVGAFPPSIEKRKTMFVHSQPQKPKHPVAFKDQPEILGKPSTSRLNPEFSVQDDKGDKGYYSDVDSEDMRTMFHPALTEEEKQRKSNKEFMPSVPFPSETDFISAKDDDASSFVNILKQTSTKSQRLHDEVLDKQGKVQTVKINKNEPLQSTSKFYDQKRDITPTRLNNSRESPDLIRRVHSEETLLSIDASVTRDFSFVFPKKLTPKNLKQKSSSELIQTTRDMLAAKAEEERMKQEEEKKIKFEIKEKKRLEEEKKRLKEELMKRLEEDEAKRIEKRRKELVMIKDEEEKRRLNIQSQDQEHVRESRSDIITKKEKSIKLVADADTTSITKHEAEEQKRRPTGDEKISDKDKKEITFKKTDSESDKGEKLVTPKSTKSKIEADSIDKSRKDEVDKKGETKISFGKSSEEMHKKQKVGAKDSAISKEKQKESQPKEIKELQGTKESKGPSELKEKTTLKEPKEAHMETKSKKIQESRDKLTESKEIETREPKEQKGTKIAKDHLQTKELKFSKDSKENKELTELKGPKETTKESKELKEGKESKEPKEPKELKESKESKEQKELKDLKASKEHKEAKELQDTKESKQPITDKKMMKAEKEHDKFKKNIQSKLQKEEKENLKKEKEEQLQIEKENKQKEKEFNKRGKKDITEVKLPKPKKSKGDTTAKKKELDDKAKEKPVTATTDKSSEAPPPITVKMEKIKPRRASPDDLILRLVRLKQSNRGDRFRTQHLSDMVSGKSLGIYHKRHVADANNMCTASDIDFEAEAAASARKKKDEQVIIGEKIMVYKKPPLSVREQAVIDNREREIKRQIICENARIKKQKKEEEEAAAKKERLEYKAKLEKAQREEENKEATGLSYMRNVNMRSIKVRRPSPDDLILQLVRLKQSRNRAERNKPKRLGESKLDKKDFKIHKTRKAGARPMTAHSDSELDLGRIDNKRSEYEDIIIGPKISKYKPSPKGQENAFNAPSYVKSTFDTNQEPMNITEAAPIIAKQVDPELAKGVIRYALSDRTFIEKGWTMLPTEKVVRKMNVYRMRPSHPEFDWFEHNKNKGMMQYDTGEKLAEFDDEGRGRWFYRNGRMALDYYDAEEMNAQQRFVIYSSGELDDRGRSQPYTLLATFDYLGNGVVFDHGGKIRLKYNQTEGVVLDRNIGPVSHWKWHTLNDPPVLQQVMIDTQMAHKDPSIVKLGGALDEETLRPDNDDMLAIEFDNFIKEKSKKLNQTFKPFQIKMKALKINEHFSLRVLDQATIYLLFRDGTTNLKLNIGMVLDHKEIVDTDTAEVGEVSTNMERLPARTDSLAGLQRSIAHAQHYERLRTEREVKIRPSLPRASVDKMLSAASQPMRAPLRLNSGTSPSATTESYYKCSRKPSSSNIYYDTRLC